MEKNVEFDQEGFFKCIKIGLFKFVFYQGLSCTCFQTSISIIIELIYTFFFTIFGSCIDIQKLVTTLVIQSEKN